ncbi:MAG: 2Fe-2S iron-sulfur cluster binding domain-containing protein [SAR202 cluster bacterium]|nr:2Fe-2S iron-sulfur cluster binding domain-containing protein [SAR202 cluster bacterium]
MPKEIKIKVNGQEIATTDDKMVIQAANDAGIYIPYLCYHPGMKPYGACRMCMVQVEMPPPPNAPAGTAPALVMQASCTVPVRDGLVVHTTNEPVQQTRDVIMDLLLSEHPHGCLTCHRIDLCGPQDICLRHVDVNDRCVTCPKNERCELKDTTRFHTQKQYSALTYQYRNLQVETKDPFFDRDYNLCIVCARCVRACDELRGDVVYGMTERAGQVLVGTALGSSLLESGCEFCGACIDVCPVGALVEKENKWERPSRVMQSVCDECPVGCQITYEVNQWEKVVRAIPELNAPANHGQACYKGKFGYSYVNHKQRIKRPMVRRDGELRQVSWEEAFAAAAEGLAKYKGNQFALIASPRNTNEELYVAQKFARVVMGTNSVDLATNDRPGVYEALADVFGVSAGMVSIDDLNAAKAVLVVSANLTEEQNVVGVPIKQAVRAGTQQLVVIDSREVELTRHATLWLRPYPGTDLAVVGGILRAIVDEGLVSKEFIDARVDGYDDFVKSLAPFTPEAVERETGLGPDRLLAAAKLLATNAPAVFAYALDNSVGGTRRPTARALANLALITGNVGKPGAGLMPLRRGANDQGALDMGAEPFLLPGQAPFNNVAALKRISRAWGAPVPDREGLRVAGAFAAARKGDVKAMLVIGDHLTFEDGTFGDTAAAFDKLEFMVALDQFLSPTAQKADVVFPAAAWLEKQGTYTNLERRVQPLRRVFKNKAVDSRADLDILCALAQRMGADGFAYGDSDDVLAELGMVAPAYAGISHRRLLAEAVKTKKPSNDNPLPTQVLYSDAVPMGLQWPCSAADHPGTPVPFGEGKFTLAVLSWRERPKHDDAQFPLMLTHGRVLLQSGHPMEVVPQGKLNSIKREEYVTLHPADAARMKFAEGQRARMVAATGKSVTGTLRLSEQVPPGVVSLTTLFGELAVELEASTHPDPMNHVPRLEAVPARMEPA